jgi:hypothetical protein
MKKLLITITGILILMSANAQIRISDLPAASEIDTADLFVIVAANGNVTRKLKALYIAGMVSDTANILRDFILTRAPLASPTFTGTVTLPSTTSIGNISSVELSYVDGVTSPIQTQLNGKVSTNYYYDFSTDLLQSGTSNVMGTVTGTVIGRFAIVQVVFSSSTSGLTLVWDVPGGSVVTSQTIGKYIVNSGEFGTCEISGVNWDTTLDQDDELYFMLRLY